MNLKDDHWEELYVFAKDLADHYVSLEEIEKRLSTKSNDPVIIAEIIQQIRKVQFAIHLKNGLTKIGFGSLCLVGGFLITCLNFHANQSFTIVMYSTSSIGIILIFWGLYEIIG
jgi:hypothetical protein